MWRLIYFLEIFDSPYGNNLAMDSLIHHNWAVRISDGQWLRDGVFFRAPLYPYFLGGIYSLFNNSQTAAKLIQMLLGCVSCLLIYHVAKRLFNETAGLIALIISSFYGMFLYFENELLIVSLIVFLDLLSLLFLLIARDSPKLSNWFLSGCFLGLSATARPNILLFAVILPLWIYFAFRKKFRIQQTCQFIIALSIGCIIPILPVTVHNYVIGKDFVLIASQGGVNFYIGNNPQSDGRTAIVPGTRDTWWGGYEDQINMAKSVLGNPNAKPSEISGYWYRKGFGFIANNPFDFLALTLKKLYLFWNAHEIGNNRGIKFVTRHSVVFRYLTFKFWLICALAFAGIYLSLRRQFRVSLLLTFILSYMISVVLFFVCARYRMPVISFLIIFASYTLFEWVRAIVDDHSLKGLLSRPMLRNSVIIFVTTGLITFPVGGSRLEQAQGYFNEGEAYRIRRDFNNAIRCYEKAKNVNPHYVSPYVNMVNVYMDGLHDYDKAAEIVEEALGVAPGNAEVLYNMGVLLLKLKQKGKARECFLKTLEANANYTDAHIKLGEMYERESDYEKALDEYLSATLSKPTSHELCGRIGNVNIKLERFPEARQAFRMALEINPNFAGAHVNIGETYLQEGDFEKATTHFEKAIRISPRYAAPYNNIGVALRKMGKTEEAVSYFDKAIDLKPDFYTALRNKADLLFSLNRYQEAIDYYTRILTLHPRSVEAFYELGVCYEKVDMVDKAVLYYSKALEIDPNFTSARNNLDKILTKVPLPEEKK
jgi:tetratricopeptide (TPR) repeat protein